MTTSLLYLGTETTAAAVQPGRGQLTSAQLLRRAGFFDTGIAAPLEFRLVPTDEGAFARGWRDTKRAFHSWAFWLAQAVAGTVGSVHAGPWGGLALVACLFAAVWLVSTVTAPVRQRDEARPFLTHSEAKQLEAIEQALSGQPPHEELLTRSSIKRQLSVSPVVLSPNPWYLGASPNAEEFMRQSIGDTNTQLAALVVRNDPTAPAADGAIGSLFAEARYVEGQGIRQQKDGAWSAELGQQFVPGGDLGVDLPVGSSRLLAMAVAHNQHDQWQFVDRPKVRAMYFPRGFTTQAEHDHVVAHTSNGDTLVIVRFRADQLDQVEFFHLQGPPPTFSRVDQRFLWRKMDEWKQTQEQVAMVKALLDGLGWEY